MQDRSGASLPSAVDYEYGSQRGLYGEHELRDLLPSGSRSYFRSITSAVIGYAIATGAADAAVSTENYPVENAQIVNIEDFRNSRRIDGLVEEIFSYRDLEENWDGEGGRAPDESAIRDAIAFCSMISTLPSLPICSVAGDGEIIFYWKTAIGRATVSFYGDSSLWYIVKSPTLGIKRDGQLPYERNVPPCILIDTLAQL